jgi:hypothetical protein
MNDKIAARARFLVASVSLLSSAPITEFLSTYPNRCRLSVDEKNRIISRWGKPGRVDTF